MKKRHHHPYIQEGRQERLSKLQTYQFALPHLQTVYEDPEKQTEWHIGRTSATGTSCLLKRLLHH